MIEDSASKLDPRQVQALPAPPPPVAQIAGLTPSFPGQVVNGIIQGGPYSITTIPGTISQNGLPNIPQFPNGIPQPQAPSFNTPGQPFGTASSTISNVGRRYHKLFRMVQHYKQPKIMLLMLTHPLHLHLSSSYQGHFRYHLTEILG